MLNLESKVEKKLRKALLKLSEDHNKNILDIRIRIQSEGEEIPPSLQLLNKMDFVCDLTLKKVLNLGADIMSLGAGIEKFMHEAIERISREESIDHDKVNFRVFTRKPEGDPEIYLYNGEAPVKPLEIVEILN